MASILSSTQLRCRLASALPQVDLSGIRLSADVDRLVWNLSVDGNFDPKQYWRVLNPGGANSAIYSYIWKPWIPPKISCFLWRLISRALPTDDRISKRGIQLASRCNCCPSPCGETIQHLFIESYQAQRIWQYYGSVFNKPHPLSMQHLLDNWVIDSATSSQIGCLSILATCCSLWEIWCFRNAARHERHQEDILFLTKRWLQAMNYLIKPSIKPGPQDNAIAASIRVQLIMPAPSRGSWFLWQPHSHGLTLSIATIQRGGGYIFRSSSGATIFAATLKIPDFDDIGAQLFIMLLGLLLAKRRRWITGAIQTHSQHIVDIFNNKRLCPWRWTYLKRGVQELLDNILITFLPKKLNQPAFALASRPINQSFSSQRELPDDIRILVEENRQGFPFYCKGLVHNSPNLPS